MEQHLPERDVEMWLLDKVCFDLTHLHKEKLVKITMHGDYSEMTPDDVTIPRPITSDVFIPLSHLPAMIDALIEAFECIYGKSIEDLTEEEIHKLRHPSGD